MVIFQMFFLVCKLCRLRLFITRYFGHGQYFIWEFLVLAFIETARLNTSSSNFSWSWNDTILVRKLHISSLLIQILILSKSEILGNIYIDRFLLVAFVKYVSPQIIVFGTALSGDCENLLFKENIFKVFLYLCFLNRKTSNFRNSGLVGDRTLLDPLMNNILMFCQLVYNILSHLNGLILPRYDYRQKVSP